MIPGRGRRVWLKDRGKAVWLNALFHGDGYFWASPERVEMGGEVPDWAF